jgi:restriction endonuclease S subunit
VQYTEYELGELLPFEQPTAYIVKSTDYSDAYATPVLTAGKSFILGKTNETDGIFDQLPVIIFDDFTTATQFVNFRFKVKSSAMKILHINTDLVIPKYIFYRLQIIQFDHSTHKRYWIQSYSKIKVLIPPLDEQFRIVARIEEFFSELDKAVDTLKTTKEQLVVYRQAILQQAFIGNSNYHKRKSSIPKAEFKPVDAKELVQLASLPQKWKYVYLSDLGNLSRGKSSHRPRNDPKLFENGVYPFFQTGDVKGAQKDLYNCEKKYNDVGLTQSKLWPAGTLCITIAANIAETCFLGVDGCFPDSIVGFIPNDNLVLKEYIRFFIEASKLKLWAYAPATAQKNINLSTLENLIVPYCGIEEQQYIVQKIEEIDSVCNKLEQTIDIALAQADAMRQSILKQAFEEKI